MDGTRRLKNTYKTLTNPGETLKYTYKSPGVKIKRKESKNGTEIKY